MRQESWLRAHVAKLEALGGPVPRIVPDNLKTGVITQPRDGEIVLNDAYRELAAHYSAVVLPGGVKKPKGYPEVCRHLMGSPKVVSVSGITYEIGRTRRAWRTPSHTW